MPLPRTIVKPTLPLVPKKVLSERREQLLEYIKDDGTYLPKSVLHADLDKGMLEFVKNELSATPTNIKLSSKYYKNEYDDDETIINLIETIINLIFTRVKITKKVYFC